MKGKKNMPLMLFMLFMLSIGVMTGGQSKYCTSLVREDYFEKGGEPPGKWLGNGAKLLGLEGTVDADELHNLLDGRSLDGNKDWVQNAGHEKRVIGLDCTFSAPKSVSTFWAQAAPADRQQIQESQAEAVKVGIAYLEDSAFTRKGKGGTEHVKASIAVAAYEHGSSRSNDVQLHTHAQVVNLAVTPDGPGGALDAKRILCAKMTAGAIYRAELAYQLEKRLGLVCQRHRSWFELDGVPQELVDEFSKRRHEIESALAHKGIYSARAASIAALDTRQAKEHISRAELFAQAQEVGRAFGFGPEQAPDLLMRQEPRQDLSERVQFAIEGALDTITQQKSHFCERDLVRHTAEHAQGLGIGADVVRYTVEQALEKSPQIVRLGIDDHQKRYTTREMFELEKKLLTDINASAEDRSHMLPEEVVERAIEKRPTIKPEQAEALRHITCWAGSVQVVSGLAGTGKTFMLEAAHETWREQGYIVRGAALSGKAAQGLQEETGIPSTTLHKLLRDIECGTFRVTPQTVIILDEAGMVPTRKMERLTSAITEAHAKQILTGDAKQLQPIEAGCPFRTIAERLGQAQLTEITRQTADWAKEVVHSVVAGESRRALEILAEQGLLTVAQDRQQAMEALVNDWKQQGLAKPQDNLIITGTNLEANTLNRMIQQQRQQEGLVTGSSLRVDADEFYQGDRVLCTRNSDYYQVKNGHLGTITRVDPDRNTLEVKLDNGADVVLPVQDYEHLRLGYSVTTHKAQGASIENSWVLVSSFIDRELAYVQFSRARHETHVYIDEIEAGEKLTALCRQMDRSRQKELAHDVLQRQEQSYAPSF